MCKKRETSDLIAEECDRIKNLLLDKNRKYGDSAFNTGALFEVPPLTAIKARINDKVSRIKTALPGDEEDPVDDLIGYLILYIIENRRESNLKPSGPKSQIIKDGYSF